MYGMEEDRFLEIERFLAHYLRVSTDPQHDWSHADRVRKNSLKIVNLLEIDVDKNLLQSICLLHDAHYTMYKNPLVISYLFEGYFAERATRILVKRLPFTQEEARIAIIAIKYHAKSFPFRRLHKDEDVDTRLLQDADTLDFFNQKRVKKFKKRNWLTRLLAPAVDETVEFGRKNLSRYLNFPEAAVLLPE
jgi:hypothetical protein